MKQYPSLTITITLISALAIGVLDLIMGLAQLPYIMILVGAAILSAFNVKQAWLIALILGGSTLITHQIVKLFGIMPLYEFTELGEFLVPIGLAFGGATIGVRISANWMKSPNNNSNEEQE